MHSCREGIPLNKSSFYELDSTVTESVKKGRTYSDYKAYMELHPDFPVMEMDTVIGRIGGKTIMTWIFSPQNFMVGFLLDGKTSAEVTRIFDEMKDNLTQEKVNLIFSHVISVSRKEFNSKSSYEMFEFAYGESKRSIISGL